MLKQNVVFGNGNGGRPIARWLNAVYEEDVVVVDDRNSLDDYSDYEVDRITEMKHEGIIFTNKTPSNCVKYYKSPSYPDNKIKFSETLEYTKEEFIQSINKELEGKMVIGITGTNGKTTLTEYIKQIFTQMNYNVLCINSLKWNLCSEAIIDSFVNNEHTNAEVVILELPHGTLDLFHNIRLDLAVVTNTFGDHLECFENDINKYISFKTSITDNARICYTCKEVAVECEKSCYYIEYDNSISYTENYKNIAFRCYSLLTNKPAIDIVLKPVPFHLEEVKYPYRPLIILDCAFTSDAIEKTITDVLNKYDILSKQIHVILEPVDSETRRDKECIAKKLKNIGSLTIVTQGQDGKDYSKESEELQKLTKNARLESSLRYALINTINKISKEDIILRMGLLITPDKQEYRSSIKLLLDNIYPFLESPSINEQIDNINWDNVKLNLDAIVIIKTLLNTHTLDYKKKMNLYEKILHSIVDNNTSKLDKDLFIDTSINL